MTGTEPHEPPEVTERLFQARLAEYVSARDEMIGAISNQHLVLTFGTASIVGVLVAGVLRWNQPADSEVFFAIPPLSAWVLAMWVAEVVRMLRPVAFCREQAAIINESIGVDYFDHPPIRWEAWRDEDSSRTNTWSYISVVVVLSGAYITGVTLGLITADWSLCWTLFGIAMFGFGLTVALWAVFTVFMRWRSPASKVGMIKVVGWPGWLTRKRPDESDEPGAEL